MGSPAVKLIQRKLYSFVSSKWGLPLCIIGILGLIISAFQFGEVSNIVKEGNKSDTSHTYDLPPTQVLLEWSKERYAAQFSVYHDNIAGKSFEK